MVEKLPAAGKGILLGDRGGCSSFALDADNDVTLQGSKDELF